MRTWTYTNLVPVVEKGSNVVCLYENQDRAESWLYLNGEGALCTIGLQVDLHLSRCTTGCHQFVAQLFQGVTAVGDQLPDEHLVECGRENHYC